MASENQPVEGVAEVTLTCSARTSDNVTAYLWYKNQIQIFGASNETFSLPNNTRTDDGEYSCEVNTSEAPKSPMSNIITINFLCESFVPVPYCLTIILSEFHFI